MDTRKFVVVAALSCAAGLALPVVANAMDAADWQGFYIGANGAYVIDKDVSYHFITFPTVSQSFDMTGSTFGIQGGYNWAVGPVVIGVEGNASTGKVDGEGFCPNPTYTCGAEMKQIYSVRARVGYPISKFLLYGVAGAAQGKVEAQVVYTPTGIQYNNSGTQSGWLAGLGGEMAFTPNLIGRVEVSYTDLGDNDYIIMGEPFSMETKLSTALVGASWKF